MERLTMRQIKEVLRLKYENGLSDSKIAKSCSIARSTVAGYIRKGKKVRITWPIPDAVSETELERLFFPPQEKSSQKSEPDWHYVYQELKRAHVTKTLLWFEYKERNPDGYEYSQFCELYRQWSGKLNVVMRQDHKAGEKVFVDYCGSTVPIIDSQRGEVIQAQVFVATLGASNYTYAEASISQGLADWITSHVHAFEYFGGVPQITVPDNLLSGITHAHLYEPQINATYQEMAHHYHTAIIPARVRKPKDKAKVEAGVKVVQEWILARLRNQTFFSLTDLNVDITDLLTNLNNEPFEKLEGSRKSLFDTLDKQALQPLPQEPYEYAEWKLARVNVDSHLEVDHHYYSVPYQLLHKQLDVRITGNTVECFYKGNRVASHVRSHEKGRYTTITGHMPKPLQDYAGWTPQRLISWAEKSGDDVGVLVKMLLEKHIHPQQGFRPTLGVIRLGKSYGNDRLNAACKRAIQIGGISYKSVESILRNGYDRIQLPQKDTTSPVQHTNIRGARYYQ